MSALDYRKRRDKEIVVRYERMNLRKAQNIEFYRRENDFSRVLGAHGRMPNNNISSFSMKELF
jgi:hypothetical protein